MQLIVNEHPGSLSPMPHGQSCCLFGMNCTGQTAVCTLTQHGMLPWHVYKMAPAWFIIDIISTKLAGEVLALRHTKEAELLPAPAVIGEAVILSDQLPAASIRPCTFRSAASSFKLAGGEMPNLKELVFVSSCHSNYAQPCLCHSSSVAAFDQSMLYKCSLHRPKLCMGSLFPLLLSSACSSCFSIAVYCTAQMSIIAALPRSILLSHIGRSVFD